MLADYKDYSFTVLPADLPVRPEEFGGQFKIKGIPVNELLSGAMKQITPC